MIGAFVGAVEVSIFALFPWADFAISTAGLVAESVFSAVVGIALMVGAAGGPQILGITCPASVAGEGAEAVLTGVFSLYHQPTGSVVCVGGLPPAGGAGILARGVTAQSLDAMSGVALGALGACFSGVLFRDAGVLQAIEGVWGFTVGAGLTIVWVGDADPFNAGESLRALAVLVTGRFTQEIHTGLPGGTWGALVVTALHAVLRGAEGRTALQKAD